MGILSQKEMLRAPFYDPQFKPAPKPEEPMRVKDLIEALSAMDPNAVIRQEATGDMVIYVDFDDGSRDHMKRGPSVWLGFERSPNQ